MRVATAVFASLLLADFAGSVRSVKRRAITKAMVEAGARSSKAQASPVYALIGNGACRTASGGRGDYDKPQVATDADCAQACSANPDCVAYEWADSSRSCERHTTTITDVKAESGVLCYVRRQATGECMNITGMYEWRSPHRRRAGRGYEYLKQTDCAGLASGSWSFSVGGSTVYGDGTTGDLRAGPPITIKFADGYNYTRMQAHATSGSQSTDRVQFVGSQFNTANCPVGTRKATRNECLQTPSYYGAPGVYYQDSIYYPGGCYFHASTNAIWWSNLTSGFSARASSQPICVPNSESQGGGMTGNDFIMWMQLNNVHAGGWACGYKDGWCGCSCGNNYAAPCSNPPMTAGTEGGRTCGWFGNLYGCAEAHNTVENCPAMR